MIHLTSWPVIIVEYGLALFCFLDVLLRREAQVRWVPRAVWALLLLCFPVAGSIGWIAAGRAWRHHKLIPDDVEPDEPTQPGDPFHHGGNPVGNDSHDRRRQHGQPRHRTEAPIGSGQALEADLISELFAVHEEHERTLSGWEEDLRRREEELRRRADRLAAPPDGTPGARGDPGPVDGSPPVPDGPPPTPDGPPPTPDDPAGDGARGPTGTS